MFCSKCGTENNEQAKFCKSCGAALSGSLQFEVNEAEKSKPEEKQQGSKKFIAIGSIVAALIVAVALLAGNGGISIGGYSSAEPCEWCNESPTKEFDGQFYCEDCSSTCWACYEKATKHFVNGFDGLTFVCDDCYEEAIEE